MSQARVAAGLAHWPALAALAGLPADGWQATLLWSREDPGGDRTVIRLDRDGQIPVVVKQSHRQAEAQNMAAGLAMQGRAALALNAHPVARVPRILAHLPDCRAALIEAVAGVPLAELAMGDDAAGAVARAGGWLDAFHRSDSPAPAPFGPRVAARRAIRAVEAASAGQLQLPKPRLFMDHARVLQAQARSLRNAPTVFAPRHGDFSGRNLLLGETLVWGIDFAPQGRAAVGVDIAKLLTFLAVRSPGAVAGSLGTGQGSLRSAFFRSYRLGDADDPTLPFLFRAQLLADWLGYPPHPAAMTAPQLERFRRIVGLLAELSA